MFLRDGKLVDLEQVDLNNTLQQGKVEIISDAVQHPAHYAFGRFEVIDVLEDWFPDEPLLWQVVKYLARAKHKGNFLQDLEKAKFYLDRRIESEKS